MFRTKGSVFERVSDWNIKGCKDAPDIGQDDFFDIVHKQIERIIEENNELSKALEEKNHLEILDAICDISVTVNGLFFLTGYKPDNYLLKYSYEQEKTVHPAMMNFETVKFISDELNKELERFEHNMDYQSIFTALFMLEMFAKSKYDYEGAITAVLDNNDDKFYTGDDIYQAFTRAAELSATTGDDHSVEISTDREDLLATIDLEDLCLDDLVAIDAIASVHRTKDDKICKPADFEGVDLTPFIE